MLKACHLLDIIGEATPPSPPYLTPGISGTVDGDGGGGGVCVEGGGGGGGGGVVLVGWRGDNHNHRLEFRSGANDTSY